MNECLFIHKKIVGRYCVNKKKQKNKITKYTQI